MTTVLTFSLAAMSAHAETAADSGQVDEIVVTARKRAEPLSQTPLPITAFRGDDLKARRVNNLEDLAAITPGMSFREDVAGRAGPAITIRGIGFDDYHAMGSPSAAVHLDEVYQGSSAWITGQLFDIDRVEVLKGPQGTLYGRNTTAGAINIITRRPTGQAGGYVGASYGSHDAVRIDGAYTMPLADQVALRIAVLRESGGGYMTNKGNASVAGTTPAPGVIPPLPSIGEHKTGDKDFWGARATLAYTPTDTTRVTAAVNLARDRGDNSQTDVLGRSATGFTEPDTDPYTYYANLDPFVRSEQIGGRLQVEHDFQDGLKFTGIASQQHLKRTYTLDPGSPLRAFDIRYADTLDQTTLEARLGKSGGLVEWVAGAFYMKDRVASDQREDVSDLFRSVIDATSDLHRESWAAFGEADWRFGPRWTATLGLRYTDETAHFDGATVDLNPYGLSAVKSAFALPVRFDNRFSDSNLSGRAVLTWRPTEATMLYASASKGFKSGGFDGATIFTASKALPFQSENVWAYEGGYKWFPTSLPLSLTASGFYYDFSNMQSTSVVNLGGIPTNVRTNVADAQVYGGELQLNLRPIERLELNAGLALLHSEITRDASVDPAEVARRVGAPLPNSPELSYSLAARYGWDLPGGWTLSPAAQLSYVGSQYKELDHYVRAKSYTLIDGQVELTAPGGRWSLSLWGKNLGDETYFTGLIPAVSKNVVIGTQRIVGAPRTIGVAVNVNF
jgi:iron complex outermembrane receptor protein